MSDRWSHPSGIIWETKACSYLQEKGFQIVERNFRTRFGEIDIVAERSGEVYIVEVKARKGDRKGTAAEQMTPFKIRRLEKMASLYLLKSKLSNRPAHLSFVGFDIDANHTQVTFLPDITGAL